MALGRAILALLAFSLAALLALALVWRRYAFWMVRYERTVEPARVFPGETVTLNLIVENARFLPLPWVQVVEELPKALHLPQIPLSLSPKPERRELRTLLSVGPNQRLLRKYAGHATRRGAFRIGPARLMSGDPFGLARSKQTVEKPTTFLVYPPVLPLTSFGLPAEQPLREGTPLRPLLDDPLRIQGVRPYQPGDDPRHSHWRATARMGDLQMRLLERTATPTLAHFLDVNTFEHFWEGIRPGELERAIALTASLASWGLEQAYQVGLWANAPLIGGERAIRLLPSRHPRQLQQTLEPLALFVPHTGYRIEALLASEARLLSSGVTIVVVTALMTDALRHTLLSLWRQGYGIVLLAVATSAGLPTARGFIVYELETSDARPS